MRASAEAEESIWRIKACDCRMNRAIWGLVSSGLGQICRPAQRCANFSRREAYGHSQSARVGGQPCVSIIAGRSPFAFSLFGSATNPT